MGLKPLEIKKPCSENWDAMKTMAEGKFCGSCQKIIPDFSDLKTDELIKVLQSGAYTCARFDEDQMGTLYMVHEQKEKKRRYWMGIAAALVAGMFQVSSINAQTPSNTNPLVLHGAETNFVKGKNSTSNTETPTDIDNKKFGIVVKQAGKKNAIQGAKITIEGYNISGTTDQSGTLIFTSDSLPGLDERVEISIYKYRYKTKTIRIKFSQLLNANKVVFLNNKRRRPRQHVMGKYIPYYE